MQNNFLQVGKTIECGHCNPKFLEGLKEAEKVCPNYKCECICHGEWPESKQEKWPDTNIHIPTQIFKLVDYKGKYDIVYDPDRVDDMDYVIGEITRADVIADAANRKEASRYYGIPAYVGKDEALIKLFNEE